MASKAIEFVSRVADKGMIEDMSGLRSCYKQAVEIFGRADAEDDALELITIALNADIAEGTPDIDELARWCVAYDPEAGENGEAGGILKYKGRDPKKDGPAVPVKESVTEDGIVCLEDGKKFKMLKRHLMNAYSMTPDEYRVKWGLPRDYPMATERVREQRARMARERGLGGKTKGAGRPRKKPATT